MLICILSYIVLRLRLTRTYYVLRKYVDRLVVHVPTPRVEYYLSHVVRTYIHVGRSSRQSTTKHVGQPFPKMSTSTKAVVGRALRETGAALKQASGAEVCLFLVAKMLCWAGIFWAATRAGAMDGEGSVLIYLVPPRK